MTVDTPMYIILPFRQIISQDTSSSSLWLLFKILYFIPELDITDKNKIAYTNLEKNLSSYGTNKHVLGKRLKVYREVLDEVKVNPEILHEFTKELYNEIQQNRMTKYYNKID